MARIGTLSTATDNSQATNNFKVRLQTSSSQPYRVSQEEDPGNTGQKRGRINTRQVIFDVTPDLVETRNVEYKTMQPLHMPGGIHAYANSSSRTFSISSIKLVSRTIAEATSNMQTLWTLRGWTMPYFGRMSDPRRKMERGEGLNQSGSQQSSEILGKPPEVLLLSAYSNIPNFAFGGNTLPQRAFATNISNVPVVITSLSLPYPSDVDYIPDENGNPIPRVMVIDIQLLETQAPSTLSNRFSLQDYRSGTLEGF